MKKTMQVLMAATALGLISSPVMASDVSDAAKLFNKKCKMCHAMDKKKVGPAVSSMNADAAVLRAVIADGKKMMPKFSHKLSAEEIDALVTLIQEKNAK